jgi:hypothetical protein
MQPNPISNTSNHMSKMHLYVVLAVLFIVIALIFIMICTVIGSYIFLFYCKKTIDEYNVFFHDYNCKTKAVMDKYGDFRISKAYLIVAPIGKWNVFLMNIVTMQNCNHIMDELMHVMLMVEIVMDNNQKKMLLIDKTSYISILTDFQINNSYIIHKIKVKHENTLRSLMNKTCERIGKTRFFNWHIYKNNCQYFIKQLVLMINDKFKYKNLNFTSKKKAKQYCNQLFYNKCAINLYYSVVFIHNFFQRYINNVHQHFVSKFTSMI